MENLSRVAEQILSQAKKRETNSTGRKSASICCDICNGQKIIINRNEKGEEEAVFCICKIQEDVQNRKDGSGLSHLLGKKTFDNYETPNDHQRQMKSVAMAYVDAFKKGRKNSLVILGQSGMGKTHLTAGVAYELLELGENVKYYTSGEIIANLNMKGYDREAFNIEFGNLANTGVLIIDDLFKSSITNYYNRPGIKQEHFDILFELINTRYNKGLPTIVNSEIDIKKFNELDQATIGRLVEMATDKETGVMYLVSVDKDYKKNYRMRK